MNIGEMQNASEMLESYGANIDNQYMSDLGASVLYLIDNPSIPNEVKRVILTEAIERLNAIGDSEEDETYLDCAALLEYELNEIKP